MKKLRALLADRKGVAAVEFACFSVFLFLVLSVALDFAFYTQQKLKLGSVLEQAAILAYNQQVGTSPAKADTIVVANYIRNFSGMQSAPAATITCNGSSTCDGSKCSCISATGALVTTTCTNTCSNGVAPANYMQLQAQSTYHAVIVPDKYLNNSVITQTAVVRLQ